VGPPAPPPPERVTFELVIAKEKGGGKVVGAADDVEAEGEEKITMIGGVEIKYKNLVVHTDRAVFTRSTQHVTAEGDVILDEGPRRLTGTRAELDITTKNGTIYDATAAIENDIYFKGRSIERVGDDRYLFDHGVLTSCKGDKTPDWSFHVTHARVRVGGYAHLFNLSIWTKKLPLFYLPYLLYPAKQDRASGFLFPLFGYSSRHGAYLGLTYFQTLGRSYDSTTSLDYFSKGYYGVGDEFRFRPSDDTKGDAKVYFIKDPTTDTWRWKAKLTEVSDHLPGGLRGVVNFQDFSDFNFFQEFERGLNYTSVRSVPSNAWIAGSWGAQGFTASVERRLTFIDANNVIEQDQYPTLQYTLSKRKLGASPFYLSIDTAGAELVNDRGATSNARYSRFYFTPELTLPVRALPWLSLSLTAGGRTQTGPSGLFWYSESQPKLVVDPQTGASSLQCAHGVAPRDGYCGDPVLRLTPAASLDIVGPVFSKIFDVSFGGFEKFKHLIEPRWTYSYVGKLDNPERLPFFDSQDGISNSNYGEFHLLNRLVAKPADTSQGSSREILSLDIAEGWSFDRSQPLQSSSNGINKTQRTALFTTLRFNPSTAVSLQAQAQFNTLFGGLDNTSLLVHVKQGRLSGSLSWITNYTAELRLKQRDQVRLAAGFDIVPRKLHFDTELYYDVLNHQLQQERYVVAYESQCWAVRVEFYEFNLVEPRQRDYRFSLTLKNIGTILDFGGSLSSSP